MGVKVFKNEEGQVIVQGIPAGCWVFAVFGSLFLLVGLTTTFSGAFIAGGIISTIGTIIIFCIKPYGNSRRQKKVNEYYKKEEQLKSAEQQSEEQLKSAEQQSEEQREFEEFKQLKAAEQQSEEQREFEEFKSTIPLHPVGVASAPSNPLIVSIGRLNAPPRAVIIALFVIHSTAVFPKAVNEPSGLVRDLHDWNRKVAL